jgi:glucosamine-phosphate N-acetyltransferase
VIFAKDLAVATGTLVVERNLIETVGHLENIVTHPQFRKLGLSTIVLQWLLDKAQSLKCTKVDLFCKPEMLSFYTKLGFTQTGDLFFKYLPQQ